MTTCRKVLPRTLARTRRRRGALVAGLALAAACGGKDATAPEPRGCSRQVEVTATVGTPTVFDWKPPCGVAWLELREQAPNGDRWSVGDVAGRGKVPNTIIPPVRYSGAPLVAGRTYLVTLTVSDHSDCDLLFTGYCRETTVGILTIVP